MSKVSASCKTQMTQAQKDLNAWKLNWIIGREYYRAQQDPFQMAWWDGVAASSYPNPNFTTEDEALKEYRVEVSAGFKANLPGWDNETCTQDWNQLACFAYWLASVSAETRAKVVGLMQNYEAQLPYLQESCPESIRQDPAYKIPDEEFPDPAKTPPGGNPPDGTPPGDLTKLPPPGDEVILPPVPDGKNPPGTIPGTTPTGTTEDNKSEGLPKWVWYAGAGVLALFGTAAIVGVMREPQYEGNPTRKRTGAGGWPLVPSKTFPGENTLACPKCGSTNIVMSTVRVGRGTGPRGRTRLGDVSMESLQCKKCGNKSVFDPKTGA